MSPRLQALLVVAVLASVQWLAPQLPGVAAQATTEAVCTIDAFDWTFNSKKQSPCLIAAYAQAQCNNGDFDVPALPEGSYYVGPKNAAQANPCTCSTPVWSLLSACSHCQNATYYTGWADWSTNCTTVYTNFPATIPPGTSIPAWAYLSVPADSQWDTDAAHADANAPESTATNIQSTASTISSTSTTSSLTTTSPVTSTNPVPTTSRSIRLTTTTLPDPTSTSLPVGASSGGGGGTNVGAIAGGVVGGVVLLAALGLVIFFLRKRRREAVGNTTTGAPPPVTPYDPPSMAQTPYAPPPMAGGYAPGPAFSPTSEQQRLYDPNDPTTFPQPAMTPSSASYAMGSDGAPSAYDRNSMYQTAQYMPQPHDTGNPFQTPLATPAAPPPGVGGALLPNRAGYHGVAEV